MPKKRQIPRLFDQELADGTIVYHWKPSKTLRKDGWINVKLGTNHGAAVNAAMDLNNQVKAARSDTPASADGDATPNAIVLPKRTNPRLITFERLVTLYKASDEYLGRLEDVEQPDGSIATIRVGGLAASTKAEYSSRLRSLQYWAMDGELKVREIDKAMVVDLKRETSKESVYKCAGFLRVLRLLLNWAIGEGYIDKNPTDAVPIPETPKRKVMMVPRIREMISEAAMALDLPYVVLAIELGFWGLQRQRDVLNLGRIAWREIDVATLDELDPRHIGRLFDPRGRLMAFRLCQNKTGTWIDAPMPPMFHAAIDNAIRATNYGYVFPHPDHPEQPMPSKTFQRRFKDAREAAAAVAIMEGDMELAEAIWKVQYRDLRRTGMTYYKSSGANLAWITALSGHAVIGHKTILDTYMPGDTASAVACVSTGLRAYEARQLREQQA